MRRLVEERRPREPAGQRVLVTTVAERERIVHMPRERDRPCGHLVLSPVIRQDARLEAVVKRARVGVLDIRTFDEVQEAAARQVFQAKAGLKIADPDVANQGQFFEVPPHVGRHDDVGDVAGDFRRSSRCAGYAGFKLTVLENSHSEHQSMVS